MTWGEREGTLFATYVFLSELLLPLKTRFTYPRGFYEEWVVANAVLFVLTKEKGSYEPLRGAASFESWEQRGLWTVGTGSQKSPYLESQRVQSWVRGRVLSGFHGMWCPGRGLCTRHFQVQSQARPPPPRREHHQSEEQWTDSSLHPSFSLLLASKHGNGFQAHRELEHWF